MPYYIKDPKRDPNFDNHPHRTQQGDARDVGAEITDLEVAGSGQRRVYLHSLKWSQWANAGDDTAWEAGDSSAGDNFNAAWEQRAMQATTVLATMLTLRRSSRPMASRQLQHLSIAEHRMQVPPFNERAHGNAGDWNQATVVIVGKRTRSSLVHNQQPAAWPALFQSRPRE